ncbi:MAG: aminoacetone oxidase family FAD-binding enzyme [Clostridia bacterium]|nr:aminoacetone oxidase family FAD-binding enzyme [Clostridia bacterium]
MSTVAVVGAGAAGIVAALKASKKHRVVLLDGNDKCGKKILLTGNGRCNYWNSVLGAHMYETDNIEHLETILSKDNIEACLDYLEKLGIYPKIKNGYYYPYSNHAASIREIFQKKIDNSSIEFKTNFKVKDINNRSGEFLLASDSGKTVKCDKVIIAAGSKAAPKTGSDGSGYMLAKKTGHSINSVLPSLTGLVSLGKFLKEWEKIRCDAKVSLFANGSFVKEDTGEIQLTSTGISGICTFNISGAAAKCIERKEKVMVKINFMPHLENGFYDWFSKRCEILSEYTLEEALESIFNYKLMFVFLKIAGVSKDDIWNRLPENKKQTLCRTIEEFSLDISGTENFERAQVCTGGVPLSEINPYTMESNIEKGLYLAGEVLDVDGRCGGYNLAFAFISGYIAGGCV